MNQDRVFLVSHNIPQVVDILSNLDQVKCPGRVRTMQGRGQESGLFACCFAAMVKPYLTK